MSLVIVHKWVRIRINNQSHFGNFYRLNLLGRNRLENEQTQHHKQDYKDAKDTLEVRLETCQGQTYAQLRWESSQRLSKNSTAAALV